MRTRRAFALLPFAPRDTVTFELLLEAMIDREALARFPEPVYQCRQASSRDPLSKRRGEAL